MSRTLYFIKININSESTYKLYDKKLNTDDVMMKLSQKIQNKINYTDIIERDVNGETVVTKHEFTFTGINKIIENDEIIIVGGVIKTATIFINNIDKITGERKIIPTKSDEMVNFCFYPKKEIVAYYCPNRFGYQEFAKAFQGLINKAFHEEHFFVSVITNGISLDDIKQSLKEIKNITTLEINIIPPNPDDDIIEKLRENAENKLESFKSGRITGRSTIFKSSYKQGLNVESDEINQELEDVTAIHSKLSTEQSTKNGYVNVVATNKEGRVYNTNNEKVIKHRMPEEVVGDSMFAKFCKYIIESIL